MREDIEFADAGIPLNVGIAYNDLGRIESYVLTFEKHTLEIARTLEGFIVIDDGFVCIQMPLPLIEAMMRLDLAALVVRAENKEDEG